MKTGRAVLALALMLAGCGGGDSGSGGPVVIGGSPTPTPTSPTGTCSLQTRQNWAFTQLKEWYLFPETLPTSPDTSRYSTLDDYIDALTAGARAQGRDRYFTYVTSIAGENAYYSSGATAGFGFRLSFTPSPARLFVTESFEGTSALNWNVDRGAEILAIGTGTTNLQTITTLYATNGTQAISDAMGPDTANTSRVFRVRSNGVERVVTLTKTDYALQPVSPIYGARVLTDGGRKIGYLNLRTFISSAEPVMRQAFADFKAQGVTEMIVDLRYNGGGLLSVSRTMASLLGGNRSASDLFTRLTFRPDKSAENDPYYFQPEANAIAATKIAFIGFDGTASASEGVINGMIPYLGVNAGLIGSNTYGKPVGQIAIDKAECDDRLRIIAFAVQNRDGNSNYYNGLASSMRATCQATDDLDHALGDPAETSIARALDYLAGRSCTPIAGATASARSSGVTIAAENKTPVQQLLTPARATTPQRDVPGLF